jgi:competence protein ComEA
MKCDCVLTLNTGTQKMLESLPSIGVVTARKIIDYRQANGRISSVEQLRDAKVITNSMYEKIKDLVTV